MKPSGDINFVFVIEFKNPNSIYWKPLGDKFYTTAMHAKHAIQKLDYKFREFRVMKYERREK